MNYITGDKHGDYGTILHDLKTLKPGDRLFICGDLGLIFELEGSREYYIESKNIDRINDIGIEILFIDGNHENFDRLYKFREEIRYGAPVGVIRPNILHLKRGYVYEIDGKKIFTFGGATSIDKHIRIEFISWWSQENHTYEEQSRAIDELTRHGMKVDYVITHVAPRQAEKVISSLIESQYGKSSFILDKSTEVNGLTEICNNLDYQEWHFGHYHIDGRGGKFHAHYDMMQKWF